MIDRISVKDGARIHIIDLEEIFYLQASGDYVTIFTTTGQYLKEQTMKYFEQSLPSPAFVRIHRSTIVHTAQIARIELFGKETYQVRLKNGVTLRASHSGYKLLKEKLALWVTLRFRRLLFGSQGLLASLLFFFQFLLIGPLLFFALFFFLLQSLLISPLFLFAQLLTRFQFRLVSAWLFDQPLTVSPDPLLPSAEPVPPLPVAYEEPPVP